MTLPLPCNPEVDTFFDIALIVPAYNPPPGWSRLLGTQFQRLKKHLPLQNITVILVNDGSTTSYFTDEIENLQAAIKDLQVITHAVNRGKGAALRSGMQAATAGYYIVTDIDFPYTTESMLAILEALLQNRADVAVGNRDHSYYTRIPGFRARLSKLLRYVIRKRLRLPVDDSQCGLKGMNEKGKQLFLQTKIRRYLYDLEFLVKVAATHHLRMQPVPVALRDGVVMRRMSPRILFQEAGNFLRIFLFRHRL
jgi:glycosyltransferase involved in cell wall biosynthesis